MGNKCVYCYQTVEGVLSLFLLKNDRNSHLLYGLYRLVVSQVLSYYRQFMHSNVRYREIQYLAQFITILPNAQPISMKIDRFVTHFMVRFEKQRSFIH